MNFLKTLLAGLLIYSFLLSCKSKQIANEGSRSPKDSLILSDTSAIYQWPIGGCCNVKAIYNPKKFSADELNNTSELVTGAASYFRTETVARRPEDIEKLSLDKLNEEFQKKMDHFKNLRILHIKYWEDLKSMRLKEMEEVYELGKIDIMAYSDPSVLLSNRFSQYCPEVVRALTSNDTSMLLLEWRKLVEKRKELNIDPENYLRIFNEKYRSVNRLDHAKVDLLTFGWHNCANHNISRITEDGSIEKEFEKLFIKVEHDCRGCD